MGKELLKAIAVCAELTGTELSPAAAAVFASDLEKYPEPQVMGALSRCRRELKGRMTLADVISRLDDGRPGVEEAWALCPKSESETAVWTEEMALAMAAASNLLDDGDHVGARMAFKEKYLGLVQKARDEGKLISWTASLGWDKHAREGVLLAAHEAGKLSTPQMQIFLPGFNEQKLIGNQDRKMLRLAKLALRME